MISNLSIIIVGSKGESIEYVDDELRRNHLDYSIDTAVSREELIYKLGEKRCDIVVFYDEIADFRPKEALRIAKSAFSDLLFFVISTNLKISLITELIKSGVDDYIPENEISNLPSSIRNELQKLELKREIEKFTQVDESKYGQEEAGFVGTHKFLHTILENIPNMIYVKNVSDLKYTYMNRAGEILTGYSREELLGKNVSEIFSKEYSDYYNSKDYELIRKKKQIEHAEEMVLTKQNRLRVFFTKKILINDINGNPKYILGISEDMTDHREAQEELKKSEIRFSKIFHSSPVAICVMRENDKIILDMNSRFLMMLGYQKDEVIGKNIIELGIIASSTDPTLFLSQAANNNAFSNREVDIITKSGNDKTLLINVEQLNFSGESWLIYMGLDITDRKATNAKLMEAYEKQKELNTLKTQFISMISHEFRTPLTTIMLSTDLLKRYSDKWTDDERSKHFNRIQDTILRMTQLMENVLIIGRIDSGKFIFNPEPMDLNEFCFSLAKNIEFSTNGDHKINVEFNGECQNTKADENLLGLIINNLLSNAVKYSPKGSPIEYIVNCNANLAEMIITDHGIGIPEDELVHLFHSFFRASNVGSTPGYGLGLSIVKKCIDTHKGKIQVRSNSGEGTTFIVTIPLNLDRDEKFDIL